MIRLVTLLALVMLAGVSSALYKLKYKVQTLDREALALQRQILAEREAIRLLEADWAYLNQPERLQALAERHLTLGPIDPRQFVTVDAIPARLVPLPETPLNPSAKPAPGAKGAPLPPPAPTPALVAARGAGAAPGAAEPSTLMQAGTE